MREGIGARSQGRVAQIVFFEDKWACGDLLRECSHDVIMMETQKSEAQLFSYAVNLAKRVRANHPLRLTTSALSLPDGRHLAVAAFVSDSAANDDTRDTVIARLAKAAWDSAQSLGR